ncbi:ABC transporter permease [Clostridia bacterium]|nr:ABC transporter permease [Clostridia bacterium]
MNGLKKQVDNFMDHRYLFYLLTMRDVKKKYKNSYLGILWSLLSPLLDMVILSIVFSSLLKRNVSNYPVYLLTGRLLFQFFTMGSSVALMSIISSAPLIKKIYVPKYILTLSRICSNYIFFLISLLDLGLIMLVTRHPVNINILWSIPYMLLIFLFTTGVGMILAAIAVYFRDMEHIYKVFTNALYFASAIIYPPEIVPEKYQFILQWNPVFHFLQGFRRVAYYGLAPEPRNLLLCTVLALVSLILGVLYFKKKQDDFILYL